MYNKLADNLCKKQLFRYSYNDIWNLIIKHKREEHLNEYLAEALSLQLDKKEIKHSVHGDDKEGVIMMQQLPETKITTTVLFLTEDKLIPYQ